MYISTLSLSPLSRPAHTDIPFLTYHTYHTKTIYIFVEVAILYINEHDIM